MNILGLRGSEISQVRYSRGDVQRVSPWLVFKPILMNIFVNNLEEGISNTVIKTQRAVLWRML